MAIDIAFKADVDLGEGAKSLRSLKQEFKDTQKELDGLTQGSEQYVNTLKKLGKVKDEIGDLNAEINSFNPEGKVQAFGNVIGGLASGFQAATGAAALFGGESKEVEKALLKVQAVMAFTEGIKGVIALGDGFKVLANIIQANPIMFIATVIIAATAAIYELVKSLNDTTEAQAKAAEEHKKWLGQLETEIDLIKKKNDIVNKSYSSEIDLLKARGASLEKINKKEDEVYHNRRSQLMYLKGFRGQLNAEESAELLALTNEKILRSEQYVTKVKSDLESVTKKNKEEFDKQNIQHKNHLKEIQDNIDAGTLAGFEIDQANQATADEAKKTKDQKELDDIAAADAAQGNIEYGATQRKLKDIEIRKQAEKDALNESIAVAEIGTDSLIALSDIYFSIKSANTKKGSAEELANAKKQFKINKALALTGVVLDTAKAAISSLSQSPLAIGPIPSPIGIASLAAVILTGAASAAKIAATQFNGGASSVGSTPAPPSIGNPPTINAPSNTNTQLNPDGTVNSPTPIKQQTIKATVVETEVTGTQKRVGVLEGAAQIGG